MLKKLSHEHAAILLEAVRHAQRAVRRACYRDKPVVRRGPRRLKWRERAMGEDERARMVAEILARVRPWAPGLSCNPRYIDFLRRIPALRLENILTETRKYLPDHEKTPP